MAASEPEFLITNLIDSATLTESSEETSLTAENIQSLFRTKVWRSDLGWNIVAGVNDKIDITEGTTGDAIATLAAGNYATGALMATHIATVINAAATDNTWTCSYSTSTRKFTIGHDEGGNGETGGLEWNTGASAATSAGPDLGYEVDADDTGAASYPSDNACRCSREWIQIDLAAATKITRGAIVSHNFSSSAVITLYRHTAATLSAATAVGTLTYDADFMFIECDATYRYFWIHVSDIDNSNSYIEIGRAFLGEYSTTAWMAMGMELVLGDPSKPTKTPEGYIGRNEHTQYKQVIFNFAEPMNETNRDSLITIYETIGAYNHFFFRPDPNEEIFTQADLGGMYGYFLSSKLGLRVISGATTWQPGRLVFEEAL